MLRISLARMPHPLHFDSHAEIYDRARPPYPDALWTRLRGLELLRPGVRVIEFGAGSGQATGPMLRAGASVTAVEPGKSLADLLRRRCPDATVQLGNAESTPLPTAAFDLAVAATAVHWFDLDVLLPRVHQALLPGGHFAVWRTAFGDPSMPVTPFRERVMAITARRGDETPPRDPGELETQAWAHRLTDSGHFVLVCTEQFHWTIELRADQIRDLFTTFSNWNAVEVSEAAQAAHDLGGQVIEHYVTPLIVLERTAG